MCVASTTSGTGTSTSATGWRGADLVVGRLERRGSDAGGAGRPLERGTVDPSRPVDADRLAGAGEARRLQHRRVLDRAVHQRPAGSCAGQGAQDGQVQRLHAGRRELHLVRAGAEVGGDRLAGGVEQQPGPPRGPVEPAGVGPAVVQGGQVRLRATGCQGAPEAASRKPPGAATARNASGPLAVPDGRSSTLRTCDASS